MPHTLSIDDVASDLGLEPQALAVFEPDWSHSGQSYPRSHPLFLTPAYVREVGGRLGLSEELIEAAVNDLAFFNHRPAALRLAWHCHVALFELKNVGYKEISRWPIIPPAAGPGATMFYFYIMLSGAESIRAMHAARLIPQEITHELFADLEIWARDYLTKNGIWGLKSLNWLWHHATGRLYQLGRLQFTLDEGYLPYNVYRNRKTRQVAVLAGDGMKFRADGQCADADRMNDPNAWTASLSQTDSRIVGHLISPEGRAVPGEVALPTNEWDLVLKPGDPTVGFHIPASGPLDHIEAGKSMARAATFFTQHFPDRPFNGFNCASWILDNQLDALLPEQSNLRKFLREMYLVPMPGANDNQTLERVFPGYSIPKQGLENAPTKTSLQKLFVQKMKEGVKFRIGGCYTFVEDLDWGKAVYISGRAWRG